MLPKLTITPAAHKFIRRFVMFSGQPAGAGFRLSVTAGGCSGYNSEFTVEPQPLPGDEVLEADGLKLFLPAESRLMLDGVIMDAVDTPTKSGLAFTNPNAVPCACSSSGDSAPTPPSVAKIEIGSIKLGPKPVLS